MPTILLVGATRGLGASLANSYKSDPNNHVLATARTANPPASSTHFRLLNCITEFLLHIFPPACR
jgi:NAD(P)-dependent dehydrogenase (short-subunit alcohol dehydrogenase family)